MNRLAVLGQPIAHSLSPAMHTAAFRALGLAGEWSYEAIELAPEEFAAGVGELRERGFVGVNVTIPHKEAALALADRGRRPPRGDRRRQHAHLRRERDRGADNTDAPGLIAALPGPIPPGAEALVLGAGGAARAAIWALREAGAEVSVHNRTASRGRAVADELGVGADLDGPGLPRASTCSSTPPRPGLQAADRDPRKPLRSSRTLGLAADQFCDRQVVVDLVYGAAATELTATASAAPGPPSSMDSRSWFARAPSPSGSGPGSNHRSKR